MRECEMYGERIAIMNDGKIQCIGSPEHIKNKLLIFLKVWIRL